LPGKDEPPNLPWATPLGPSVGSPGVPQWPAVRNPFVTENPMEQKNCVVQ